MPSWQETRDHFCPLKVCEAVADVGPDFAYAKALSFVQPWDVRASWLHELRFSHAGHICGSAFAEAANLQTTVSHLAASRSAVSLTS